MRLEDIRRTALNDIAQLGGDTEVEMAGALRQASASPSAPSYFIQS